jgi:hypothetical protein
MRRAIERPATVTPTTIALVLFALLQKLVFVWVLVRWGRSS